MKLTQVEITTVQLYLEKIRTIQKQMQTYINEQIYRPRKLKGKYDINVTTWEIEATERNEELKP